MCFPITTLNFKYSIHPTFARFPKRKKLNLLSVQEYHAGKETSNVSSLEIYACLFLLTVLSVLTIHSSLFQEENARLLKENLTKQKEVCSVAFFFLRLLEKGKL